MGSRAVVATTASDGISGLRLATPLLHVDLFHLYIVLDARPDLSPPPGRDRGMPGSAFEDELYASYTSRPGTRLPADDDLDVDSPVLGLWADVEEKRGVNRKSGECRARRRE